MSVKILLRKTSLVDYSGKVSSVFFFPVCNLRCPWCHNGDLILGDEEGLVDLEEGLAHLAKRKKVLGGVVLSGGEPSLYEGLPCLIEEIKNIGLPVKLDTNGMNPAMLEKLFGREESRPDFIALDLKISPCRYGELGSLREPGEMLIQSAALIRQAGIDHEYRTLALPNGYIAGKDIEDLAPLTDTAPWRFRLFRGGSCLDPAWNTLEEPSQKAQALTKTLAETAVALGKSGIA